MQSSNDPSAWINAHSRLLTEPDLLQRFRAAPFVVAAELECHEIASLCPNQITAQRDTLIRKRFGQLKLLLPKTIRNTKGEAWQEFQSFAIAFWPTGHDRHAADATKFAAWLRDRYRIDRDELFALDAIAGRPFGLRFSVATPTQRGKRWGVSVFVRTTNRIVAKRVVLG